MAGPDEDIVPRKLKGDELSAGNGGVKASLSADDLEVLKDIGKKTAELGLAAAPAPAVLSDKERQGLGDELNGYKKEGLPVYKEASLSADDLEALKDMGKKTAELAQGGTPDPAVPVAQMPISTILPKLPPLPIGKRGR